MKSKILGNLTKEQVLELVVQNIEPAVSRTKLWWFDLELEFALAVKEHVDIPTLERILGRKYKGLHYRLAGQRPTTPGAHRSVHTMNAYFFDTLWSGLIKCMPSHIGDLIQLAMPIHVQNNSELIIGFGFDQQVECDRFNSMSDAVCEALSMQTLAPVIQCDIGSRTRQIRSIRGVTLVYSAEELTEARLLAHSMQMPLVELGLILNLSLSPLLSLPLKHIAESELPPVIGSRIMNSIGANHIADSKPITERNGTSWTEVEAKAVVALHELSLTSTNLGIILGRPKSACDARKNGNPKFAIIPTKYFADLWSGFTEACKEVDSELYAIISATVPMLVKHKVLTIGVGNDSKPDDILYKHSAFICRTLTTLSTALKGSAIDTFSTVRIPHLTAQELMHYIDTAEEKNISIAELSFLIMQQREYLIRAIKIAMPATTGSSKSQEKVHQRSVEKQQVLMSDAVASIIKPIKEEIELIEPETESVEPEVAPIEPEEESVEPEVVGQWSTDPVNTLDAIVDGQLQRFIEAFTYLDCGAGGDIKKDIKDMVKDQIKRNIIHAALDLVHESDNES